MGLIDNLLDNTCRCLPELADMVDQLLTEAEVALKVMLGFDQISNIVLELSIPTLDIFLRQGIFIRVELVEVLFQLFLVFFLGLSADVSSLVLVYSEVVALSVVAIHTLQ